jgi:hypothetical protein
MGKVSGRSRILRTVFLAWSVWASCGLPRCARPRVSGVRWDVCSVCHPYRIIRPLSSILVCTQAYVSHLHFRYAFVERAPPPSFLIAGYSRRHSVRLQGELARAREAAGRKGRAKFVILGPATLVVIVLPQAPCTQGHPVESRCGACFTSFQATAGAGAHAHPDFERTSQTENISSKWPRGCNEIALSCALAPTPR